MLARQIRGRRKTILALPDADGPAGLRTYVSVYAAQSVAQPLDAQLQVDAALAVKTDRTFCQVGARCLLHLVRNDDRCAHRRAGAVIRLVLIARRDVASDIILTKRRQPVSSARFAGDPAFKAVKVLPPTVCLSVSNLPSRRRPCSSRRRVLLFLPPSQRTLFCTC